MTFSSDSRTPLDWKFSQVFGERAPGEDVHDGQGFYFHPIFYHAVFGWLENKKLAKLLEFHLQPY